MPSNTQRTGTRRKGGGQPNNTNALKFGIYSRRFHPLELSDLETGLLQGVGDEIYMMRVQTRRLFEISDGKETREVLIDVLNALGSASTRLAGLVRTQEALKSHTTDIASILSQALSEVMDELKPHHP
jgi:hypothetical protein